LDNGQDTKDKDDEDTELGKVSDVDEPGWLIGTMSKVVQQHMERFRKKQIQLDELIQLGYWDAAD
jgi:hypothetical protein